MTKYVATGRKNTTRTVYHTDKECNRLSRSTVRETTQNEIEHYDLELCEACSNSKASTSSGSEWHEKNRKLRFQDVDL